MLVEFGSRSLEIPEKQDYHRLEGRSSRLILLQFRLQQQLGSNIYRHKLSQ